MKTKVIKRDGLVEGQILTYTGKGFLGYVKGNHLMKFKKIDDKSVFDIWVEYQGKEAITMLVSIYEVKPC